VEDEGAAHAGGPRVGWIRWQRGQIRQPPEQGRVDLTTGGAAPAHPTQCRRGGARRRTEIGTADPTTATRKGWDGADRGC
jgi:hypothetical protein